MCPPYGVSALQVSALQRLPYKSLTRKTFRSEVYCPSYRDVRFMVCPSYRDSTVEQFKPKSEKTLPDSHTWYQEQIKSIR